MTKETEAVYAAEQQLRTVLDIAEETDNRAYDFYGSMLTLPIERKFASIESIETYCNTVLNLEQVRSRYPNAGPITVRQRRGERAAHYEYGKREMAINTTQTRWALREIVVLHELAHHLTPYNDHGAKFREAHAFLVTECVGAEIGIMLYAFYDLNLGSLYKRSFT